MATEQDHVWAMLDDMLVFLSKRHVPTPERTYKLDGGWTLAMDDLRRFVDNLIAERDQLRAELAAAKDRGDGLYLGLRQTLEALGGVAQPGVSEAFLILGVPGEAAALKRVNTALAADNARLRKALEEQECRCRYSILDLRKMSDWGLRAKCERCAALAATPAQSLAAHDAAVKAAALREICKNRSYGGMCRSIAVDYYEWIGKQPPEGELSQRPVTRVAVLDASEVMAEADCIEKEAAK